MFQVQYEYPVNGWGIWDKDRDRSEFQTIKLAREAVKRATKGIFCNNLATATANHRIMDLETGRFYPVVEESRKESKEGATLHTSELWVENLNGTRVRVATAPEGYEFTGELRVPEPGEPYHCAKGNGVDATWNVSGGVEKLILRPLKSAKERRAERMETLLTKLRDVLIMSGKIYASEYNPGAVIDKIERIFEEER